MSSAPIDKEIAALFEGPGLSEKLEQVVEEGWDGETVLGFTAEEFEDFKNDLGLKKAHAMKLTKRWKEVAGVTLAPMDQLAIAFVHKVPKWVEETDLVSIQKDYPMVQDIIDRRYKDMDAQLVLNQLKDCGKLLKLALMAAGKSHCRRPILELVNDFHTSNGTTKIGTMQMVQTSLKALGYHQMALKDFDDRMFSDGMEVFRKVSTLAKDMVEQSGKLEDEAEKLQRKAEQCLMEAEEDRAKQDKIKEDMEKKAAQKLLEKQQREKEEQAFHKASLEKKKQMELKQKEKKDTDEKIKEERKALEAQAKKDREAEIDEVRKMDEARAKKMQDEEDALNKAREKVRRAKKEQSEAENTAWGMDALRGLGKFFSGGAYKGGEVDEKKKETKVATAEAEEDLVDLQKRQESSASQAGKDKDRELQMLKKLQEDNAKQQALQEEQIRNTMESAKDLAQQAQQMEKEAYAATMDMIKKNSEIQKLLVELRQNKSEQSEVARVIQSLEICIQTMGKIKVTFQKYRIFWAQMKAQTSSIADLHGDVKFAAKRDLERVRDIIYVSAQSWAAVGMLNSQAHKGMDEVLNSSDDIMNSLPSASVPVAEIQQLADQLHKSSLQETKQLEESTVRIEEVLADSPEAPPDSPNSPP